MSVIEFEPVNRQSTAEMIADRLRAAIVHGALRPGSQLVEADLATQFDVSRGPVREAMQRLVSEGLLHSVRHRGIFVIELSPDDVADVYRARTALEGGALELILEGRREIAYRALEPSVDQMRECARDGDATGVTEADHAFHQALVTSADSPRLVRAAQTLLIETRMCLGALQTTYTDLNDQVREHVTLRDAIADGPAERVRELLAGHMRDAVDRLGEQHSDDTA